MDFNVVSVGNHLNSYWISGILFSGKGLALTWLRIWLATFELTFFQGLTQNSPDEKEKMK